MRESVAVAALLVCAGSSLGQFVGPYDHANWTFNANGGDGSAVTTPDSLLLTGNDAGGRLINTDYTIAAVASGTWSFDWLFSSIDTGDFDTGGYLLNGVYVQLANTLGGSGSVSLPVNAGDEIGFRVYSFDGLFGPGVLEITNFSGPVPAPAGAVIAMWGCGMMAMTRRREK